MNYLELREIVKRFGAVLALDRVSLEIAKGELVALVGPSGCGKTTLLRLIAGLETPDAGDILLAGQSVLGVPPEQRRVGLVFQNYALFPHMTVWQNVAYGLKFRRGEGLGVSALLELVGLTGLEDRKPAELSAGQQQRVALARALAPNPHILLLDEPLSALDAQLRQRLRTEIKRIQRTLKITTIYVTHDQEEALAIADRVAVMQTARVEHVGTPWEVYQHPKTEFVARFIGRGNLVTARVVSEDPQRLLLKIGNASVWAKRTTPLAHTTVRALIRPERIRFGSSTENKLCGRIVGREFTGDRLWVHLQTESHLWVVQADLSHNPQEGTEVEFGFNSEDVYVLPDSATAEPALDQPTS